MIYWQRLRMKLNWCGNRDGTCWRFYTYARNIWLSLIQRYMHSCVSPCKLILSSNTDHVKFEGLKPNVNPSVCGTLERALLGILSPFCHSCSLTPIVMQFIGICLSEGELCIAWTWDIVAWHLFSSFNYQNFGCLGCSNPNQDPSSGTLLHTLDSTFRDSYSGCSKFLW